MKKMESAKDNISRLLLGECLNTSKSSTVRFQELRKQIYFHFIYLFVYLASKNEY